MLTKLTKAKNLLLNILFPQICISCKSYLKKGEQNNAICNVCISKIPIHTTLFCSICRARLPENKKICHKDSLYLLGAATNYDEIIKNLIHQFKYQQWARLTAPLNILFKKYLNNLAGEKEKKRSNLPNIEKVIKGGRTSRILERDSTSKILGKDLKNYTVIPIPLHKDRQKERGFNQAELLGKIVAKELNLPLETTALTRTKETKSQAELRDWDERKENLRGSFLVQQPEKIAGKNIILVDDVYTSGATINEAVKTLRSSDARKIIALVVAKTK